MNHILAFILTISATAAVASESLVPVFPTVGTNTNTYQGVTLSCTAPHINPAGMLHRMFNGNTSEKIGVGNYINDVSITISFPEAVCVNGIEIWDWITSQTVCVGEFEIRASNDGSNWQVIASFPSETVTIDTTKPTRRNWYFTNNKSYYQWMIYQPARAANFWRSLGEIKLYGSKGGVPEDNDPEPDPEEEPDPYPNNPDLSAIIQRLDKLSLSAIRLEYVCGIVAVCSGLGLGLVMWRLVMLSKNQRKMF